MSSARRCGSQGRTLRSCSDHLCAVLRWAEGLARCQTGEVHGWMPELRGERPPRHEAGVRLTRMTLVTC